MQIFPKMQHTQKYQNHLREQQIRKSERLMLKLMQSKRKDSKTSRRNNLTDTTNCSLKNISANIAETEKSSTDEWQCLLIKEHADKQIQLCENSDKETTNVSSELLTNNNINSAH